MPPKDKCTSCLTFIGVSVTFDGLTSAVTLAVDPRLHPVMSEGAVSFKTRALDAILVHGVYSPSTYVFLAISTEGYVQLRVTAPTSGSTVVCIVGGWSGGGV